MAAVDARVAGSVVRFDRTERALHWANATLFLVLLATGMILYIGPLSAAVGRRVLVKDVHVISGLVLPLPVALAYAGTWRSGLQRDVRRLARWSLDDRRWLLSLGRRGRSTLGKFNAGQKLNSIFVVACIPVMLGTGAIMRWFGPFPLDWRTGATFVHDWVAIVLLFVIVGHIAKALSEPIALRAMWRGTVPARHAELEHPRWWAELESDADDPVPAEGTTGQPS
ncbi:MAG: cytochrome b/b6 domain-containing protein [Acidimicrobiales bacterium]|nr:cytochrome b/b6 domain-containing protein [Acidimicrobiales bacterium]